MELGFFTHFFVEFTLNGKNCFAATCIRLDIHQSSFSAWPCSYDSSSYAQQRYQI